MSVITISTSLLRAADPTVDSSNFQVNFVPPIELGSLGYEVALLKLDTWFTSQNVIGKTIVWSSDNGVTPHTITIENGNYTIEDINILLALDQRAKGVTDVDGITGEITYGIVLEANYNTNKARIKIDNSVGSGYQFTVDLTAANNLSVFLGFTPANITSTTSSDTIPQVNGDVDQWQLRCSLIRNSFENGKNSDILFNFVPEVPPSAHITINPLHLSYFQVNTSTINSIRFRLTDQNGNDIDLAGEDMVITLILRKKSL